MNGNGISKSSPLTIGVALAALGAVAYIGGVLVRGQDIVDRAASAAVRVHESKSIVAAHPDVKSTFCSKIDYVQLRAEIKAVRETVTQIRKSVDRIEEKLNE